MNSTTPSARQEDRHCDADFRCYNRADRPDESGLRVLRRESAMAASSLRPRVGELVFDLFDRPLHPELFDTLAVRAVRRDDYELTVRITRTGHVITWQSRQVHLTEVTADEELPLPQHRACYHQRVRGEHCATVALGAQLNYQSSFQVETLPQEIFLHVHDEILRDGAKRGLMHNFQPNHRLALAPLGHVTVEAWAGHLLFSSFHTFPDENTIVKTQSLIERK
jgi:hypothetical protein